jgi:hypothetical protein
LYSERKAVLARAITNSPGGYDIVTYLPSPVLSLRVEWNPNSKHEKHLTKQEETTKRLTAGKPPSKIGKTLEANARRENLP